MLLDDVAALSLAQLSFKPAPTEWSILEVVQHLVLSERSVMCGMPDLGALIERRPTLRQYMSYPVVLLVLGYSIPFRTPSPEMVPDGRPTLPELRAQWAENHRWLQRYIDSLTPRSARRAVFYHPIAGPISVRQTLTMAHLHLTTHTRQIEALKQAVTTL
ncbi:MAG TPA: DinB family protein [Herpetosiphonaceae bacterium]